MDLLSKKDLEDWGWASVDFSHKVFCWEVDEVFEDSFFWRRFALSVFHVFCDPRVRVESDFEHHPDVWCDFRSSLPKESLSGLLQQSTLKPLLAPWRFFFFSFDALSEAGLQSLLKLLEEPSEFCFIVGCVRQRYALPLTLQSRCQVIRPVRSFFGKKDSTLPNTVLKRLEACAQRRPFFWLDEDQNWSQFQVSHFFFVPDEKRSQLVQWIEEIDGALMDLFREKQSSFEPSFALDWMRRQLIWWQERKAFHLDPRWFLMRLLNIPFLEKRG